MKEKKSLSKRKKELELMRQNLFEEQLFFALHTSESIEVAVKKVWKKLDLSQETMKKLLFDVLWNYKVLKNWKPTEVEEQPQGDSLLEN